MSTTCDQINESLEKGVIRAAALRNAGKITINPIGSRVLLQPIEPDAITAGGIHVPPGYDTAEKCPACGIVVAMGRKAKCKCDNPDCDAGLPGVDIGMKVLFHRFDGTEINYRDRKFILVDAKDIKAIIE